MDRPPWPDAVRVHGGLRGIQRVVRDVYHIICTDSSTIVDFANASEYYVDSKPGRPTGWYTPQRRMTQGYDALTQCLDGVPIYNGVCFNIPDMRVFIASHDAEWIVSRPLLT